MFNVGKSGKNLQSSPSTSKNHPHTNYSRQRTIVIKPRFKSSVKFKKYACRFSDKKQLVDFAVVKELDEETNLYYYGARYLDPRTSRWLTGDPAIWQGDYIPVAPVNDEARKHNQNLPGMGGVFNVINLHAYRYAGNNPIRYIDPDGRNDYEFAEVYAPADGTVYKIRYFGNDSDYGNYVIIQHDDGRFSLFAHLEGPVQGLAEGNRVIQGELIAIGGATGRIENMGAHLHWSVFEGVDEFRSNSDNAIFNMNWVVNAAKTIDPQILVDAGVYMHPSLGEITDPYGTTGSPLRRGAHEGIDYSLVRRRIEN